MCKHEWNKHRDSKRCINCGRYLSKDGSITIDMPSIVEMNRINKAKRKRPKYKYGRGKDGNVKQIQS